MNGPVSAAVRNSLLGAWRQTRPTSSIKVLVVDDEESVRYFVNRVLVDAGYQTVTAANGPGALEIASTMDSLDLLLTDLMMPDMNGDVLAQHLRMRAPHLKVLYFTGFSDILFSGRSTLWEDEVFLDKPASANGLLQAVLLLCTGHTTIRH